MGRVSVEKLAHLIGEAGLSNRESAKFWIFSCPKCGDSDKVYLYKNTSYFKCMKCPPSAGFKGSPEWFFAAATGQSVSSIREFLYEGSGFEASKSFELNLDPEDGEEYGDEFVEPTFTSQNWPYYCLKIDHPKAEPGRQYLEGRGIPLALAQEYGIRYSRHDRAVGFPVLIGNILVGWQLRKIDPVEGVTEDGFYYQGLKIMTYEIPRDQVVMFNNRLSNSKHAVICEGPVDAIKAHGAGGNIATMGKSVSRGQILSILRSGIEKVYFALDPDAARMMPELLEQVGDLPAHFVEVPPKDGEERDMGDLDLDEARDIILGAPRMERGRFYMYLKDFPRAKVEAA